MSRQVDPDENTQRTRRRVKASLVVARDIVRTVLERDMRPGERYLAEADAIKHHGVGRGTYREALRFLEAQGVIVIRSGPHGGPEIRQPDWTHLASTVALLLQFADAPLGSILEARIAIEPGMVELAARNATDRELADMAGDLDSIEANLGDYTRFSEAYDHFWGSLARSSHNPLLGSLSPAMRAIVNSAGFVPNEVYRAELLDRLRSIHAHLIDRDATSASAAMRELDLEFQRRLLAGYPRRLEATVAWSDLDPPG